MAKNPQFTDKGEVDGDSYLEFDFGFHHLNTTQCLHSLQDWNIFRLHRTPDDYRLVTILWQTFKEVKP